MNRIPWFSKGVIPLYLAPMAGVTDFVFRGLCKELGADVMVTEFVSAEGILRADKRTRHYTEFADNQHPIGVQLFGCDGKHLGEAAKKILDWKQPDFIDINYGCPVNKVVAKNGGSSLLKDCPLLQKVASEVVSAVGSQVPVTAKIRIGWDENSINAVEVCRLLENVGIEAISIHGRTRAQGYRGKANWEVIASCVSSVSIPIVGNGDISSAEEVLMRVQETGVQGIMIGRAAVGNPWIFQEIKMALKSQIYESPSLKEKFSLILKQCERTIAWGRYGNEQQTMQKMRGSLLSYCKSFPKAKGLREKLCRISSLREVSQIFEDFLAVKEI